MASTRDIQLADLIDDAAALDTAAFADKHGAAFLVQSTVINDPSDPRSLMATTLAQGKVFGKEGVLLEYLVHPVKRLVQSRFGGEYIGVGRSEHNSVVVNDSTVSKFHAFFLESKSGYGLNDAGSKNGTFLNDTAVPSYRDGDPKPVSAGDTVRFGDIAMTFMGVDEVVALAKRAKNSS